MVRPRRIWLRVTLLALGLAIIVLPLVGGLALTCRPSWYQPLSIDYSRVQEDKRAQLGLENDVSAAMNDGRAIVVELEQGQVNRWIAARHELWPAETPSIEPFERPQVTFLSGNRVRLAALVEYSGMRVVLSTTFLLELRAGALAVTWGSVHAGALPAPQKLIEQAARKVATRLGLAERAVSESSLTFPIEGTWPNGKCRVRIAGLSVSNGVVRVSLEPL